MEKRKRRKWIILNTTIWRVFAYFLVYSFLGYLIETCFALISGGVLECRQSFLYGPFCAIYGVGSVALVLILKSKFSKNNYTLFWGGVLIGSITEYLVSFLGEIILGIKWWDYSDKFLNINGRVCLIYSLFWGILALYLIKSVNPKVDKMIDTIRNTFHPNIVKVTMAIGMVAMLLDALVSCLAINYFSLRVTIDNNLEVQNMELVQEYYNEVYVNRPELAEFIYKYWGDEFMLMTYPNMTIELANGDIIPIRKLYPDIKPYYFKFSDYIDSPIAKANSMSNDIVVFDKRSVVVDEIWTSL